MKLLWIATILVSPWAQGLFSAGSYAETQKPAAQPPAPNVKYKASGDVNFEQLIVQGQLQRPDVTVVTGSTDQGTDGLLRLRENFLDKMSVAIGEEPQQ